MKTIYRQYVISLLNSLMYYKNETCSSTMQGWKMVVKIFMDKNCCYFGSPSVFSYLTSFRYIR